VNPGVAQKSANITVTVSAGSTNSVAATVTAVPGAAAYAWYVGNNAAPGTEKFFGFTTVNAITVTSIPGAGQLASALAAADLSANSATFDGMLAMTVKSGRAPT
jgi:hypothetical protein